jgi:hypothetical protein
VRERSPRAPTLSVRKALERADNFYDVHRRHAVRVDSAVEAWGYSLKSSGGRQAISTLVMYGILQDAGSGAARTVQLSELAWRWMANEHHDQRLDALRRIALTPKIMAELWDHWGANPPGDGQCLSHLRLDLGFTETTASDILEIYKDNIVFSRLADTGIVSPANPAGSGIEGGIFHKPATETSHNPSAAQKAQILFGERELTTGLLSKGASFRLVVSGHIGSREIERLISKLILDKEILAEEDSQVGS